MASNEYFFEVRTGVGIEHINKFSNWARCAYPVASFGKYGRFPKQYITLIFPKHLEEDVMIRKLSGDLSEKRIKERFGEHTN